jgi:hypothetical protein
MKNPKCDNPDCKGWGIFTPSGSAYYLDGKLCIQRCDVCNVFEDDFHAQAYALKHHLDTLPARVHLYRDNGMYHCTVGTLRRDHNRAFHLTPIEELIK